MSAGMAQIGGDPSERKSRNQNGLAYNIYDGEGYDGDLVIAGEVVPVPVFVDAHRRAREKGAERDEAKPIHTPVNRLPGGRNY